MSIMLTNEANTCKVRPPPYKEASQSTGRKPGNTTGSGNVSRLV